MPSKVSSALCWHHSLTHQTVRVHVPTAACIIQHYESLVVLEYALCWYFCSTSKLHGQQVMMPLLPEHLLTATFAAIRDDLVSLALHQSANFGVQAALAACNTPEQVTPPLTLSLIPIICIIFDMSPSTGK